MRDAGWLKRQLDEAASEVESWPDWLQTAELKAARSQETPTEVRGEVHERERLRPDEPRNEGDR